MFREIDFSITASRPTVQGRALLRGPGLARRIAADRLASGAFTSVDDLTRVPGIGPRIIERIRPFAVAEALDLQASAAEHPPTPR
ncbi:MAG: helix-hairpin-helix domain-containing protein [Planctomycetes bacterium]|nr:helix-hairpin-helix domain-containing protein [Planctomycetota bacterium]